MAWEDVKKFVKETGEKIIGKGPEVGFRNEVIEESKTTGDPPEMVQKRKFADIADNVSHEISSVGFIEEGSEDWREFNAAINELFTPVEIKEFEESSNNPSVFRHPPPFRATSRDHAKMTSNFQRKFDGDAPAFAVIRDSTDNALMLRNLSDRLNGELAAHSSSPDSISDIIKTRPEIGADIGMIMQLEETIKTHERMFGKEKNFHESMQRLKSEGVEALTTMLWSAPVKLLGTMLKEAFNPNFKAFVRVMGATLKFVGEELVSGSKLITRGADATATYLNKLTG